MDYLQYLVTAAEYEAYNTVVLNLIINGLPSIHFNVDNLEGLYLSFKPYYKWITFNT